MPVDEWTRLTPEPEPLPPGKKWHVFLSYRSVNRAWVMNLYDILRQRGHQVFLDQVVLTGGASLITSLSTNLRACRSGILVWSSAAADSKWVAKEYELMETMSTDGDFHFVPIRVDQAELPGFANLRLFYDFAAYPDGPNGGELLRLLHAIVERPLSEDAARFALEQDIAAKKAWAQIKGALDTGNAARLQQLFEANELPWRTTSVLACQAAEALTKLKKYDEAIAMLEKVERDFPVAVRPKQLRALALARRSDATKNQSPDASERDLTDAQDILSTLKAEGHVDPETLGIYGRTWMDRFVRSGDILDLRRSRNEYDEAFKGALDDYYTGINAAAKSVLLGEPADIERGIALAQQVEAIVGRDKHPHDYWKTATVAEVQLLQKNYELAGQRYADAVEMASKERGSHESTWLQACRIMRALSATKEQRAPVRAAFAHLPDGD